MEYPSSYQEPGKLQSTDPNTKMNQILELSARIFKQPS